MTQTNPFSFPTQIPDHPPTLTLTFHKNRSKKVDSISPYEKLKEIKDNAKKA